MTKTVYPQLPARHQRLAFFSRQYRREIELFFRRRGCSATLAEDLTQDVFVRIAAYPQIERIANPRAFLYRIAANLVRDTGRSAQRRPAIALIDAERIGSEPVDPITPERILEGRQQVALVARAFADLTLRTQRMFVMHRIDRVGHRDIASHFGLSISLVEKSLRGAHRHLKAQANAPYFRKASNAAALSGIGAELIPAFLMERAA